MDDYLFLTGIVVLTLAVYLLVLYLVYWWLSREIWFQVKLFFKDMRLLAKEKQEMELALIVYRRQRDWEFVREVLKK